MQPNKSLIIVDSHHKVLGAWAAYRASLAVAPRLISLDHHTDTSKPFRTRLSTLNHSDPEKASALRKQWIEDIRYSIPSTIDDAIQKLNNDEHIITAILSNVISGAFIVAHNARDTDLEVYQSHKVACFSVDRIPGSRILTHSECDKVLESDFLDDALQSFDRLLLNANEGPLVSEPYIFDIDLDYFNTRLSLKPADPATFKHLVKHAGLITIATEPEYVKSCALDKDLTSEELLTSLKALMEM